MSAFSLIDSIATEVLISGQINPELVEPKLRELEKTLFEPVGRQHLDKLLACVESARTHPENTGIFLNALDVLSGHLESLNDARAGQTRARHSSLHLQAVSISELEPVEYDTTQSRDLLDTFFEEYVLHVQTLQQQLWTLQTDPGRQDAAEAAFRIVHTMKGNCGFLALNTARKLAHEMENILSRGREKPLDGLSVELLLRAVDVLSEIGVRMAVHSNDAPKPFPLVPNEFASILDLVRRAGAGEAAAPAHDSSAPRPASSSNSAGKGVSGSGKTPLQDLFQRMVRMARDVARREEKEIDIHIEADSALLEHPVPARLAEPLLHLASNAVAHGVSSPAERRAAGKPARAQIVFRARLDSRTLVLQVCDDGAGLDCERILLRARARGWLQLSETPPEQTLFGFIFMPAFSTKALVSETAGRGVGLDVVKTTIEDLGGKVSVSTVPRQSTTFELRLPLLDLPDDRNA